jgi:hypothetical protein
MFPHMIDVIRVRIGTVMARMAGLATRRPPRLGACGSDDGGLDEFCEC